MSDLNVRKALGLYLDLEKRIERDWEQVRRIESQLFRITSRLSDSPGGKGQSDWASSIDMLQKLETQLRSNIELWCKGQTAIKVLLQQVENCEYRAVLEKRYLNGKSWMAVAKATHYSMDRVWHINSEAMRKIKITPEMQEFFKEIADRDSVKVVY